MPLVGFLAISLVWIITQFASVGGARSEARDYRRENKRLALQLKAFKSLPGRVEHAEGERDTLKLKAAAITVLTRSGFVCTNILQALAEAASGDLCLMSVSIDVSRGNVTIKGYGSEERADIDAASFVRSLNQNKTIMSASHGAELNYCNSSRRGEITVKQFGVSFTLRDGPVLAAPADDKKEDKRG
jgi:hypothetical protein